MGRPANPPVIFWSRTNKTEGCWLWTGGTYKKTGYGRFNHKNKATGAHRHAYTLTHGPIPAGLNVLHRCDNRLCVRPDHLFLGTQADNIADMVAKGRQSRKGGRRKLTDDQVRDCRARAANGATGYALAKEYKIDISGMYKLLRHETYPNVC